MKTPAGFQQQFADGIAAEVVGKDRRLLALPAAIADLPARYWSLPKSVREDFGLRPGGPAIGYSGAIVLGQAKDLLLSALADRFPPRGDSLIGNENVFDADGAIDWIDSNLGELASRLGPAEAHVNGLR